MKQTGLPIIRFFTLIIGTLAAFGIASSAVAQSTQVTTEKRPTEFDISQRQSSEGNPPELLFAVRFANDQKRFRQGEVIQLEMRFASASPGTYRMDAATYDRSGRLNLDKFHIEPNTGFTDPMRDHLGIIGGGLRGIPTLEEKPYLIVYDLNEWFRFDQPGRYRLYITSPRVSRNEKSSRSFDSDIVLSSNIVEFEIVKPEEGWAAQELQRIVKELDGGKNHRTACRALRFLGTKEAVPELVRRYGNDDQECSFEYYAGLIGTSHRDLVIQTMAARLTAPDQPVSGQWFHQLVSFTSPPWSWPDSYDEQQAKEYRQRRSEIYAQNEAKYAGQLAKAIGLKTGKARAISLNTLIELRWDKTKLPDVSTFFSELPPSEQGRLLEHGWQKIGSPSLLPTLRKLYQFRVTGNTDVFYDQTALRTLALQRLYELAPEEGRRLILAEMKRAQPQVRLPALTLLSDETLPEFDQIFIDNFERGESSEIHSALIERYGSPNLYGRISALLSEKVGEMACFEQSHLLAYCLRVDAAGGEDLIRRALNAREHTHCYPDVLGEVARLHFTPELETLALEVLNDPDPELVASAASVLGRYGSSEAEAPLWKRFEQWHQTWNGRERELSTFSDNEPLRLQTGVEQALLTALSEAPGWLASPKELVRLTQLCVTQGCQENVSRLQESWNEKIILSFMPYENEWGRAEIGHYRLASLETLKQKLMQFPKGTVFQWRTANDGNFEGAKQELFTTLQTFLDARGMRLIR